MFQNFRMSHVAQVATPTTPEPTVLRIIGSPRKRTINRVNIIEKKTILLVSLNIITHVCEEGKVLSYK